MVQEMVLTPGHVTRSSKSVGNNSHKSAYCLHHLPWIRPTCCMDAICLHLRLTALQMAASWPCCPVAINSINDILDDVAFRTCSFRSQTNFAHVFVCNLLHWVQRNDSADDVWTRTAVFIPEPHCTGLRRCSLHLPNRHLSFLRSMAARLSQEPSQVCISMLVARPGLPAPVSWWLHRPWPPVLGRKPNSQRRNPFLMFCIIVFSDASLSCECSSPWKLPMHLISARLSVHPTWPPLGEIPRVDS